MQKFIKFWVLIALTSLLAGCTNSIDIYLHSAPKLNQDQKHKSLPVQVRIYQLKDKNAFSQATFRELWQTDTATLGNSLLDKKTITVKPDETTKVSINCKDKCKYIGIAAIFRSPQGDSWHTLYEIPDSIGVLSLKIKVNLHNNTVTIMR